jgi:hypothetical protein
MKRMHPDDFKALKELQKRLNTQDNLATANPLYCVQQKRRIYGVSPAYHDTKQAWVEDSESVTFNTNKDLEHSLINDYGIDPEKAETLSQGDYAVHIKEYNLHFRRVNYIEIWEFVTAHFTNAAAKFYIEQNRHNLTEPRVYVDSQHRCWEWNTVVKVLKGYDFGD